MVVRDLDIPGVSLTPFEAHAILRVYPDRVLTGSIAREGVESIGGGGELGDVSRGIDLVQLRASLSPEPRRQSSPCSFRVRTLEDRPCVTVAKGSYHFGL